MQKQKYTLKLAEEEWGLSWSCPCSCTRPLFGSGGHGERSSL